MAHSHHLPVYKQLDDLLTIDKIDYIISVQYHLILHQKHIDCAKLLAINLHMAPLPEYRGCNSFSFAIINQALVYGTTLHVLNAGIDTGDILFERSIPISANETAQSLYQKTTCASIKLFRSAILKIIDGNYVRVSQLSLANRGDQYFHLRKDIDLIKEINLFWSDDKIDRYVRANFFPPFTLPFAIVDGKSVDLSLDWKNEINL